MTKRDTAGKAGFRGILSDVLLWLVLGADPRLLGTSVEVDGAVHQEGEGQQRLAGPRPAADERRPSRGQPAARDLVEAADSGTRLCELATLGVIRQPADAIVLWCFHALGPEG